ncbi:hypothetical protein Ahy_B05g079676 isoform E [Arachis hypogaea]|uniref:Aminotransferase-like plant mobile domain-containing protein n=1 Tax=Arachis hypogaea TaxID=3818 RepID=A0A444ZAK9_ARAHY|nr:hypothetical protein Ahy_B05g079676 isoform E [Arachis hypogaea]
MPLHERIIPYLETADLYHLDRLISQWLWVNEPLLSAFVERWRPETHTFHMPFGECAITLQDVAYQLGLPIDGEAVSGCLTDFHERFWDLPADTSEETVRIHARAYIMMLLLSQLFADKNANRVHLRWLPYLALMDDLGRYSWGSAALAWLYRCLCHGTNRNVVNVAGPLQLLQSWIFWRFFSLRPCGFDVFEFPLASSAPDVAAIVHPDILVEEHRRLWMAAMSLIYFVAIEWHQVDRVVPQFGGVQHLPQLALNIDWLHAKDGRGGDRWFSSYYQE